VEVQQDISLKPYNSFSINAKAMQFAVCTNVIDLPGIFEAVTKKEMPHLVLGGGSNILFTKDFDGLVVKNEIKGITIVREEEQYVYVKAGAGENWHQLVLHCVQQGWGGIENLALIPGCVGASPIQNIGAYGVELKDFFYALEAWHINDKCNIGFKNDDCRFGYRDSIFKNEYKNKLFITSVTLRLQKQPKINTSYQALEQELQKAGTTTPGIKDVCEAVIRIRSSKLPDPAVIGNAGSFFKNPIVSNEQFHQLQLQYPKIIGYAAPGGKYKLAAGWLIETCGFKGVRRGDAGCHEKQALVLVNHGNATGEEIWQLSENILTSVYEKFGVLLEREVNVI
jgi:UDP-N-acetylmuramate dehydrogenase